MSKLFNKILIANRSEIAVRVIHTCKTLGIPTVAVYSDADIKSKHRLLAGESVHIGESAPLHSYLNFEKIIAAAKSTGSDAIHPGYGFLAENAGFAEHCRKEKIKFIGPTPESMRLLGDKVASRKAALKAKVPIVPGMESTSADLNVFKQFAHKVGYPILIKASAGGGGKGMRAVGSETGLKDAIESAQREALKAFGDDRIYLEKLLVNPRHIEFQILADEFGNCIHLFERECSIQRRHQKIIEETPSLALDDNLRERMGADAVKIAAIANYTNAGTVEFLLDQENNYYFLEMNTRLQVEHPITEMVTGLDLVAEQIRIAAGHQLNSNLGNITRRGHAIECRIYAEDPANKFLPSSGKILYYNEPSGPGIRIDSGVMSGSDISIEYDPIMAKLITCAPDRNSAISKMIEALKNFKIIGVKTARAFMMDILKHDHFKNGNISINFIDDHMSGHPDSTAEFKNLAAATAAALTVLTAKQKSTSLNADKSTTPSPWELLGNWSIGSSINE
jgi:acetyl-CoA carboxylase biotin carboxylase subunit